MADLALRVRPRYHFAGGLGVHFARPPYLNKDLGTGAAPGLTQHARMPTLGHVYERMNEVFVEEQGLSRLIPLGSWPIGSCVVRVR